MTRPFLCAIRLPSGPYFQSSQTFHVSPGCVSTSKSHISSYSKNVSAHLGEGGTKSNCPIIFLFGRHKVWMFKEIHQELLKPWYNITLLLPYFLQKAIN